MNITGPRRHLVAVGQRHWEVWKRVDAVRAGRAPDTPDWPDWCFLPTSAAAWVLYGDRPPEEAEALREIGPFAALEAWRVTQGIYRFDNDILASVWDTPLEGRLPAELLLRLPEWCVYLETPGRTFFDSPVAGFFAYVVPDPEGFPLLLLVFDARSPENGPNDARRLIPFPVRFGSGSLGAAVRSAVSRAARLAGDLLGDAAADEIRAGLDIAGARNPWTEQLSGPVSAVLYLCSVAAEYRDAAGSGRLPSNPAPKRTRRGPRLFAPDTPTVWETAYRLGAALRHARAVAPVEPASTGIPRSTPRPHVRRAQWHAFWAGPKGRPGERQLKVRWLPPIPVNVPDARAYDGPAVTRTVE